MASQLLIDHLSKQVSFFGAFKNQSTMRNQTRRFITSCSFEPLKASTAQTDQRVTFMSAQETRQVCRLNCFC